MGPLGMPVLSLAMDAVSKVDGEDALCSLITLFSKCRESLQDGPRLENMVWRLWHRERWAYCPDCPISSACSYPGAVASTFSDTSALSSDDSSLASSDENHHGDQNKVSHLSRLLSSSRATPSLAGSNGSRRTKRPSRSSAHYSANERASSTSSLPRSDSGSPSRRPSLVPHRTHSNTSVGKIMVDLLPEKLVVPNHRNSPSSTIESVEDSSTLAPSASDVPAVVVMPDSAKGDCDGDHERTTRISSLGPSRAPTVVIVNPTPHPTPPMTPHVQSPEHSTQDAVHRAQRDNLVVPSRAARSGQVSASSSSTTLAEASSPTPRPKPDTTDTVVNAPVGTGANGNGIGRPSLLEGPSGVGAKPSSRSGTITGNALHPSEHHLLIHPRHSQRQKLHKSQLQAPSSSSPQILHRDVMFYIAKHAGSPDGDSPETSGSSHVGSHSQSMSVSNCTGDPGTSVASVVSGISGTSPASDVSHCTTSQSPISQGPSEKDSQGGQMRIQTHPHAKLSKASTSVGSASGSEVLRMKSKPRKGKDARFGRPALSRTQSGFRQATLQQGLYQAPVQQQSQQPQQPQQTHASRVAGKMVRVASGFQLNTAVEKAVGAGVAAPGTITTSTGPAKAQAGISKPKSPRESAGNLKTPVSPRHQQQLRQNSTTGRQPQTSTKSTNGAVASSSKARIDLNDSSDEVSDEDWEDESSAISGDVTEDGDAKSTKSVKRKEDTKKEDAKKASLLNEAAKEAQRQSAMFAKVDRRSYTNLNRTQSGLLTSIFHPDPERFPQNHPYRLTRSSHDIMALSNRRWMPPYSPLPQGQGKGALAGPVAAVVTTEVSQSPAKSRSKLRLKGCPEAEMEESDSGEEDTENTIQMSTSVAAQRLAALQSKSRRQPPPPSQPQPPAGPPQAQPQPQPQVQSQLTQAVPMAYALGYPYDLLPQPIPPSTPRTTRRNMLRKELPESLRRNLLWERQVSKQRPIGLGAGTAAVTRRTASATGLATGAVNGVNGNGGGNGNGNTNVNGNKEEMDGVDGRAARGLTRNHRSWADEFHVAGW